MLVLVGIGKLAVLLEDTSSSSVALHRLLVSIFIMAIQVTGRRIISMRMLRVVLIRIHLLGRRAAVGRWLITDRLCPMQGRKLLVDASLVVDWWIISEDLIRRSLCNRIDRILGPRTGRARAKSLSTNRRLLLDAIDIYATAL